jgi:glycosyltransferase involved in cell wall biosynthesis
LTAAEAGRLVIVPADSLASYERAGYDWLPEYFNPQGLFREVFIVSPFERGRRQAYGATVVGATWASFGRIVAGLRPQVMRAYAGFWPADITAFHRPPDVPLVVSVHDTNPKMLHDSVRFADRVICISGAVEELVLSRGVARDRIRRLPNRVNTKRFRPVTDRAALDALERRFPPGKRLLHIGRKVEQKNLDNVISALQKLPPEYSCIFVGQGDAQPFQRQAEQMGVADRCFWVDAVQNAELPVWYSWCDCMFTPSRWEGFGIVFIEAAACGAPIVTSNIAPMTEYLTHGVSAHLVTEYEDPGALAAAARAVCEDPSYRNTLSVGAVAAAQPFDRDTVDAIEVGIYREALALPPRPLATEIDWWLWRARIAARRSVSAARHEVGRWLGRGPAGAP